LIILGEAYSITGTIEEVPMPILRSETAPQFELPGLTVKGLAAPSRGARETSVWRLHLAAGTAGAPHTMTREEIFVAVSGRATAVVGGETHSLGAGDTLIVPAGQPFSLTNPGSEEFVALAVFPVGGQAAYAEETPFTPPWAA
jgi:mannose-6-phosphate isomerase-like protein (cupin superfamily)